MKQKNTDKKGFTLAELIASVAITSILMAGMAAFFSNSFRQIFSEGYKIAKLQGPTVVSASLGKKFSDVADLEEAGSAGAFAVLKNDTKDGTLPFTYIGTKMVDGTERIVFKDFFVFNGRSANKESKDSTIENPGGMANIATDYYVTAPLEDDIYKCDATLINCTPMNLTGLNQPMDIATDGTDLYVTDAGNNRVIKIEDMGGENKVSVILSEDLNFPTGIVYYLTGGHDYLFVSDTYHHLVKKINLSNNSWTVVVGDGKDKNCGDPDDDDGRQHSALFCQLNFPTGLVISSGGDADGDSLYISDTGNGRVLRVSDPGIPRNNVTNERISFTFGDQYAVEKITFEAFVAEIFDGSSMTDSLKGDYDSFLHQFEPSLLFVAYDYPNPPCNWSLSGNNLYIDPSIVDISHIEIGDIISVEGTTYEVQNKTNSRLVCDDGAVPTPSFIARAHRLVLDKNLSGVSNGSKIYFGSKGNQLETIDFKFDSNSFNPTGFQAINIDIFEFGKPDSVETHQHFLRVGDSELGTAEDVIKVFANHPFPTGLGWSNDALVVSEKADYKFDPSSIYDYTSDFKVQNFSFTSFVPTTKLLQLDYEAHLGETPAGEDIWKPYSLSANLNK